MATHCPVCDAPTKPHLTGLVDDRYGFPGSFAVHTCGACGHAHLEPPLASAALRSLYTDYYPRTELDPAAWRPSVPASGLAAWWKGERRLAYTWVPLGVRVLDIGCGFAQALGYHRARGCDVHGVEADENVGRLAAAQGLDIQIGPFDPGLYRAESFDYITMDQVLEHMADPVATLRGVAHLLRSGGHAVVSTPNVGGWGANLFGRRWIHWHVPYHAQFFTRRSLCLAAERSQLEVVRASSITSSDWLYYQWWHLVSYPPAGTPSPFWSPRGARQRPRGWTLVLAGLHQTGFDHLMTRLFDALSMGDNHLFVLRKG